MKRLLFFFLVFIFAFLFFSPSKNSSYAQICDTCATYGWTCGTFVNGCGQTLRCGNNGACFDTTKTCVNLQCVAPCASPNFCTSSALCTSANDLRQVSGYCSSGVCCGALATPTPTPAPTCVSPNFCTGSALCTSANDLQPVPGYTCSSSTSVCCRALPTPTPTPIKTCADLGGTCQSTSCAVLGSGIAGGNCPNNGYCCSNTPECDAAGGTCYASSCPVLGSGIAGVSCPNNGVCCSNSPKCDALGGTCRTSSACPDGYGIAGGDCVSGAVCCSNTAFCESLGGTCQSTSCKFPGTGIAGGNCPGGFYCCDATVQCPICPEGYKLDSTLKNCIFIEAPATNPAYPTTTECPNLGTQSTSCNGAGTRGGCAGDKICYTQGCDTTPGDFSLKCNGTTCSTALGDIQTTPGGFIKTLFSVVLSLVGGIAVLLIIISGYRLTMSQGNPEKVQLAREQLTAAVVGLIFVIFSLVVLQVIGVDILAIPGFSGI